MKNIECIIFDYGRVISLDQDERSINKMAGIAGIHKDEFVRKYLESRYDYDKGILSAAEYWNRVLDRPGIEKDGETVNRLIDLDVRSWTNLNPKMLAFIDSIAGSGIKTAILSNMTYETLKYLTENFQWLNKIDYRFFSCEMKTVKPEKRIYERCLSDMGIEAGKCLFIDDSKANTGAADSLGINAILFTDFEKMKIEFDSKYA